MSQPAIIVPDEVLHLAEKSVGQFFHDVAKTPVAANARDHVDVIRPLKKGRILEAFTPLQGKKLLEIGCGFGTNLATWIKQYGLDAYGTERDTEGFSYSLQASSLLFTANGLDPQRVIRVTSDVLPFEDGSFDVVYSGNVLEHTENPHLILREAVRVLRPGGYLHVEVPNYLSYFEGHYFLPQPPLIWKWMLPAWVRLFGRDPAFARTMRTELNPIWFRRAIGEINGQYPIRLLSLGEEVFLDRLKHPFDFEMERTADKLGTPLRIFQAVNIGNWIGWLIVLAQGHYPIYLTAVRE